MYFRNTGFGLDRPSSPLPVRDPVSSPTPTREADVAPVGPAPLSVREDIINEPTVPTTSADTSRSPAAYIDPSERPTLPAGETTDAETLARRAAAERMKEPSYTPPSDDEGYNPDLPKEPKEPEVDAGTSMMTILMVAAVGALFLGPLLLGKKK